MTSQAMPYQGMKAVVMAGGTGGHVFPALSVAEQLRQGGAEVCWLGTARGIEADLVPKAGIELNCLTIEGVRGRGLMALLKAPFKLLSAVMQARKVLRREGANVVLGLGGFASGPGGVAAKTLGIPVVIHEQNAVAGTTNRWLARVARFCLEAFPGSLPNAVHVGNPVRSEIGSVAALATPQAERPARLLVLGGSLGARALNQLVPQAIALMAVEQRPEILHQCGTRLIDEAQQSYAESGVEANVRPFIEDMAKAYEWADLVICRAGALTVSELTMAGRAAMLVPYPYAIDDHQAKNAEWLVNNDAALMCRQEQLTAAKLKETIELAGTEKAAQMAANAKQLAMPQAAHEVAGYCQQAYREKAHG
ncbi:MAG: undecaprenyldiphospho-muramoylpentapeptide beta-N-acetylglucosaminyltransferase [Candidatus Pelagadaptatus aseana]|uniref:undecaprenyldiphospho-muramoylpentapeptide beta-N-acetylglucosaminyltransferase n=1 Tax=Candidatus Pelagadaptatus aseana TaxID=3120508 RepID=UPI0039B3389A